MPDVGTATQCGADIDLPFPCDEVVRFRIICRHGKEYFGCDNHVGSLLIQALAYDGRSGVRVETVGWTGG